MGDHAYLSPSASHRWLHCTLAPSLEAGMEDVTSDFAIEGTLAHQICECKLREFLEAREVPEGAVCRSANEIFEAEYCYKWEDDPHYNEEMEETSDYYYQEVVMSYLSALEETPDAKLFIETRIDIRNQLFGTVDAMIIADGLMQIFDYKHGKGVKVSSVENSQMMIYAIGAYLDNEVYYDIKEVSMTIVQPRIHNTSSWAISAEDLLAWNKNTLEPKVKQILLGKDLTQEAGAWCKFCKIKKSCRKLAELATETSANNPDPHMLTIEEVASLLPKVETIKMWCEALSGYALDQALGGIEVPGYKLVEGRTKRVITDEAGLVGKMTENGFSEEAIYKPKEIQTITALEKLVGKKKFSTDYGEFVDKSAGKPTLVTLDDKRPAIGTEKENDFDHINIK